MRPDKRFTTCVVKVALHEEVEQVCCITANGAQLGVTAFQDLIAECSAHVSTALKECARKLEGDEDKISHWKIYNVMIDRVSLN